MGIIQFSSRRKLHNHGSNAERWLPPAQRTVLTDKSKCTPTSEYLYRSFVLEVKKLSKKGLINLSRFPEYWEIDIGYKNFELPVLALDEISLLPFNVQAKMIVNMISFAHDGWVRDNSADFFGYYMGLEFLFLPIELAGEQVFRRYYDILAKRLNKIGLDGIIYDMVKKEYHRRQKEYLIRYHISNSNDFINLVVLASEDYTALSWNIRKNLKDRSTAFKVANQLMYRSPELIISKKATR